MLSDYCLCLTCDFFGVVTNGYLSYISLQCLSLVVVDLNQDRSGRIGTASTYNLSSVPYS